MSDILKYFHLEAAELLEAMQRASLALEREDDKSGPINELKRSAHSLKGAARLVEFFDLGDEAHEVEDYLVKLELENIELSSDHISELLQKVDALQEALNEAVGGGSRAMEEAVSESTPKPQRVEGVQPLMGQAEVEKTLRECRELSHAVNGASVLQSEAALADSAVKTPAPGTAQEEFTRVATSALDEVGRCAGELLELSSRAEQWGVQLSQLQRALGRIAPSIDRAATACAAPSDEITSTGDYSQLQDEIKAAKGAIDQWQNADELLQQLGSGLDALRPLSTNLHRLGLSMRLTSVENEAYRFEKIVRSAALELGREVEFDLRGGKVRVDRLVLQSLIEPLGHLLRNSLAHGIESADEREACGKPRTGSVMLTFQKRADMLCILVEDDGAGLDLEKIRQTALGRNEAGPPGSTSDDELSSLIFKPGFTTKEEVSKLSGRGVGLDVVASQVQQLRGSIRVESQRGSFCRFLIAVPSNLDVVEVFVLESGGQQFLVPLNCLVKTWALPSEELVNYAGREALILDGAAVPVLPLQSIVSTDRTRSREEEGKNLQIAVIESHGYRFALACEGLGGRQPVVVRSIGPLLKSEPPPCGGGDHA